MSLRQVSSVAASLLFLLPGAAFADGPDPLSAQVQAIFQRTAHAIVRIQGEDDNGEVFGTGFFIDPEGTIYTNYSVGGVTRDIVVTDGVAKYPATRIAADPRSGLAILKVEAQKTPFLPLGKASDLSVASMIVAIGYPFDLPLTPSAGCVGGFGIISANDRYFAVSHIRANISVQGGEGGAPLLNMNGEVVGILESSFDGGGGCFALPIEAAEKVRADVLRFGNPRPGWLGICFDTADGGGNPIEITGFVPDSPAADSGLKPGDAIQKIGDRKVSSIADVLDAAFYLSAGDEIPVTVSRGNQTLEIKVQSALSPVAPEQQVVPQPTFNFEFFQLAK